MGCDWGCEFYSDWPDGAVTGDVSFTLTGLMGQVTGAVKFIGWTDGAVAGAVSLILIGPMGL